MTATDHQLHHSLQDLEREIQLLDQSAQRERWIEDHADLLHTYTAIEDELAARTTDLAITYQFRPPADVLETLGRQPPNLSTPSAGTLQSASTQPPGSLSDPMPTLPTLPLRKLDFGSPQSTLTTRSQNSNSDQL